MPHTQSVTVVAALDEKADRAEKERDRLLALVCLAPADPAWICHCSTGVSCAGSGKAGRREGRRARLESGPKC